jgi:signal transduction histidine kinase
MMALAMGLGALVMLATGAFVVWSLSAAFNDAARRDAHVLLQSMLSEQAASARTIASDYAVWDAMVDAVMSADVAWMDPNVGSGTMPGGPMDFLAVIRRDADLGWTWMDGSRDVDASLGPEREDVRALVSHADRMEDEPSGVLTTFSAGQSGTWMLALAAIASHSGNQAMGADGPLLIVGVALTPEIISSMGQRVLLHDLTLENGAIEAGPLATLALQGVEGPVAALRWTPPSPATAALMRAAPVLAVGALVGGGLLVLVGLHVLRAARELEAAMTAAQAADRAKSRFLAIVSHELRTPMNGVIGMLQMLERETLAPTARRWSQTALASAQSLVRLVDGLLTFSSLEGGAIRLNPTAVDPADVLSEVAALFEPAALARELTLIWTPPPPSTVVIDAVALRQIATNLIGNAIKFADQGEVRMGLVMQPEDDGVLYLVLTVDDDGPGVPAGSAERIFEAFEQAAEPSSSQRGDGVGLGLSIVRRLANAMDGDVKLVPTEGRGARFEVTLRARTEETERLAA